MKRTKKALSSAFFIALFLLSSTNLLASCPQLSELSHKQLQSDFVRWIVDGDTIHTQTGRKLRLLHINSPELNPDSNKPAEFHANESRTLLAKLTPKGSRIYWAYDTQPKDKYGRELVLVFDQSKTLVNLELIKNGAASSLIVPPNEKLWQCFKRAQASAKSSKLGIWKGTSYKKSAKDLTNETNFHWVSGKVTKIKDSKKYRWIILDNNLWVGVKRQDFQFFQKSELQFSIGNSILVGGYLYHSYGELRMNLRHPAMLSRE